MTIFFLLLWPNDILFFYIKTVGVRIWG